SRKGGARRKRDRGRPRPLRASQAKRPAYRRNLPLRRPARRRLASAEVIGTLRVPSPQFLLLILLLLLLIFLILLLLLILLLSLSAFAPQHHSGLLPRTL